MAINIATTIGNEAEVLALEYLQKAGCKLRQKNFRCKVGEIDLIIEDSLKSKVYVVFVEVRYRSKKNFGSGAETVNLTKQRKIIKAAQYYMRINKLNYLTPCRFDVISISLATVQAKIEWIKDAFRVS